MGPGWAIGLDLGGTNARLALVDRQARIRHSLKRETRHVGTPAQFAAWAGEASRELIRQAGIRRSDLAGMGVGVPGPVDAPAGRLLVLPNLPTWKNVPIRDLFKKSAGMRVEIDNDGNAMTLAEHRFGAARGTRHTLFLTLGTGIGCGIIYDGKLFRGAVFSAAEISHMRHGDYRNGARCGCGSRGCIETRIGNRRLRERAEKNLKPFSAALRAEIARDGAKRLELEHVTRAARAGDKRAAGFWAEAAEELGDFLGGICNLLNPEMIVIGGGVAGAGKFLFDPLRSAIRRHAFAAATRRLKIVPAKFGADAGTIGAAALAFARSEERK